MALEDWFGQFQVSDLSEPLVLFVDELTSMLDEYCPTKLARGRSYIRHVDADTVELQLAHAEDPANDILVEVSPGEATVMSSLTHEHVYPDEVAGEETRVWTGLVVDIIASMLRGDVIFETVHRGSTWVKTRTIVLDENGEEQASDVAGSLLGLILLWRPKHISRHRTDFGVGEARR